MPTVLFLCTGNYYRSRFAEHVFNERADELGIPWRAESRALALERGIDNVGPMSPLALAKLRQMGIQPSLRMPQGAVPDDFKRATRVVALNASEHRPLLEERYTDWTAKNSVHVEFWTIDDIGLLEATVALPLIVDHVEALCQRLKAHPGNAGSG
jgi:protein-tyrosine phosphatase